MNMDEDKKIEKIYQITAKLIKALEEKDVIKMLDAIEEAYRGSCRGSLKIYRY